MKRFLYHSAVSVSPTFARVLGALSEVRERAPLSARCCLVPATPSQTPAWTRLAAPCTPIFCTPSFSRALTQHSRCVLPHLLTSDVSATSVHRIIRPTAPAHCRRTFQQRHMIGYYQLPINKTLLPSCLDVPHSGRIASECKPVLRASHWPVISHLVILTAS